MKTTVLVVGDACRPGEFHMGDEAMFEVSVRLLRDRYHLHPIGVVEDVEIARERYGIDAVRSVAFEQGPLAGQLERLERLVFDPDLAPELHGAVRSTSLLVIAGGGNLASGFGYLILERLLLSRLARRYDVPVVLMSQSIGPVTAPQERDAVAEIVSTARIVGVREFESWLECLKLGVATDALRVCGGDTLELCNQTMSSVGSRIALSLDTHLWHGDRNSALAVVSATFEFAQRHDQEILVLPQTWREEGSSEGTDQWVTDQIRAFGREYFPSVVTSSLPILTSAAVVAEVTTCSLVVSSRYHPVVFATSQGIPAVFVSANSYTKRKGEGTLVLSASPGVAIDIPFEVSTVTAAIHNAMTNTVREGGRRHARLRQLARVRDATYREIADLARGAHAAPRPKIAICTIVASNYLAQAAVLEESVARWHPEATMVTLVVDDLHSQRSDHRVSISEIGLDASRISEMAAMYTVTEFSTAVKPSVLTHLLGQGFDQVWYLDPDTYLFAPLMPVESALRHGAIAVTPHALEPYPHDGMTPTEADIRLSGIYNLGFIAVTPSAQPFLDWWEDRLRVDAVIDLESGLFTDQKWLDFAPSLCDTVVLDNPGLNVAYWNLHERHLAQNRHGDLVVNREPLFFFHFSGFDPREPNVLSRHAGNNPRESVFSSPVLRSLVAEQAARLNKENFTERTSAPYRWDVAANGVVLDPMIRACVRRFVKASSLQPLPNPFAAESIPDFELWLDEHVGAHWRLVPTGVRQLWHTNRDLQDRFPDPCGRDAFDLLTWASKNRWVSAADQDRCRDGLAHLTKKSRELLPVGFNVVGYLTAGMGLGEASRRLTDTLSGTGLPVHVIGQPIHHGSARNDIDRPIHNSIRYTNSLVAVNANSALEVCRRLGIGRNPLGRTVGLWFWELETFPEEFAGACEPFDEIWTASDFMRDAIRRVAPIPVHTMKLEIPVIDRDNLPTRNDVGFDDRFTYFFTYDANSIFHRKNPLGLIAAYRHAFYSQNDARLVIRVLNAWRFPNDFAALIDATADRRDIDIVAASRSAAVARAEIAHADCFVSLHRSEGFGLNIATAAAAGTPVIATNYSGCTDFLDPAGSWLTPFRRVRVGEGSEPYSAQAWWAEPDHDHAVAHIRDVYESADARDRAQKARDFIAEHYSHRRAVARMGDLLGIETRHG